MMTQLMLPCLGSVTAHTLSWADDVLLMMTNSLQAVLPHSVSLQHGQISYTRWLRAHLALQLRKKLQIPQAPAATVLVLNNSFMVETGQSLPRIAHPTLPVCIMGYQQQQVPA